MLLLSYFDRIKGPVVYMTAPGSLAHELKEEYQEQIKSLLDTNHDGFFTHFFSRELKTANYIFSLESSWARGRQESVMITVIAPEEEPDYTKYEKVLEKFSKKIQSNVHSFKGFYAISGINTLSDRTKEEILTQYNFLETELDNLYKILAIKRVETEGQLISFSKLQRDRTISVSKDIINKLRRIQEEHENCFMVFRGRGSAMKLDIIPVDSERIYRLAIIFGQQVSVNMLQLFSRTFSFYDDQIKLIFTSGLCQETDKCIYEVYIDTDQLTLNEIIQELYKIEGIIEIEIELISRDKGAGSSR